MLKLLRRSVRNHARRARRSSPGRLAYEIMTETVAASRLGEYPASWLDPIPTTIPEQQAASRECGLHTSGLRGPVNTGKSASEISHQAARPTRASFPALAPLPESAPTTAAGTTTNQPLVRFGQGAYAHELPSAPRLLDLLIPRRPTHAQGRGDDDLH